MAAISAAITNNHPEGIKGAQATAAAIWMARNGKTKEEIREYIEKTYGYDLHKTYEYWHPIYWWVASCQETVPQAIISFLDSTDFEDAIRKAVSLGGDSDTLACITGGIAEAYYKEIPRSIAEQVVKPFPKILTRSWTQCVRKQSTVSHVRLLINLGWIKPYKSILKMRIFRLTRTSFSRLKERIGRNSVQP